MAFLLALPVLVLVLMLQSVIVSSFPLLNGYADLVLLVLVAWSLHERARSAWGWALIAGAMVGYVSALPLMVPIITYFLVTALARLVIRRVWQTPILTMFLVTLAGSLISQGLTMAVLIVTGTPLPILESINQVIMPGVLLNLLLALPVYAIVTDMANWIYPEEIEV